MQKIRLTEQYATLFEADEQASIIEEPKRRYLSLKGTGPLIDNPLFTEHKRILQGIAFMIKFSLKQDPPIGFFDYFLPPYEIIRDTPKDKSGETKWTLLLLQPNFITEEHVLDAYLRMKRKHDEEDIKTPKIILKSFPEKKYIHILHTGAYGTQTRSLNRLEKGAAKEGYILDTKQHEILPKQLPTTTKDKTPIIIRYLLKKAAKTK